MWIKDQYRYSPYLIKSMHQRMYALFYEKMPSSINHSMVPKRIDRHYTPQFKLLKISEIL